MASAGTAGVLVWVTGLDRAAAAVGLVGGIIGLYVTWSSYQGGGRDAEAAATLAELTDRLAVGVRSQWEAEAGRRRLNDPYPLPVRWVSAAPGLTDDWAVVERLASTGAGWPPPTLSARAGWASVPADLAGVGGDLIEVLARVPTGRLVVLGEPGSGKTMLLVRLVLDLLARRVSGSPLPVLVPLASWNPAVEDLNDWLATRLSVDYPVLASRAADGSGRSRAGALLRSGLILAVLDGLDEIPASVRGAAIARINDELRPGQAVVLSSRTAAFREATEPAIGAPVRLTGAAAIELCPLPVEVVGDYLRASAGGAASAARWGPLLTRPAAGRTQAALQALTTPLMATLARTIYNPRPDERPGAVLPDPGELADPDRFDSGVAVEQHLLDAFIPAAYRRRDAPDSHRQRGRWAAPKAERYLRFLAGHLQGRLQTTDLAWWQLTQAAPRPILSSAFGLMVGLIGSLAGVGIALAADGLRHGLSYLLIGAAVTAAFGVLGGLIGLFTVGIARLFANWRPSLVSFLGGLIFALIFAAVIGVTIAAETAVIYGFVVLLVAVPAAGVAARLTVAPARTIRWRPRAQAMVWGIPPGLAGGLLAAYAGSFDPATGAVVNLGSAAAGAVEAAGWWLAFGLGAVIVTGIQGAPVDPTVASSPRAVLSRDRRTAYTIALVASVGVVIALVLWAFTTNFVDNEFFHKDVAFSLGKIHLLVLLASALLFALPAGLAAGFLRAMWAPFVVAQYWLALRRQLPWRLMAFLADAHERGVLRQAGGVYQFRHAELQQRLAGQ